MNESHERIIHKSKKWANAKTILIVIFLLMIYLIIRFIVIRLFPVTPEIERIVLNILLFLLIGLTLAYSIGIYLKHRCEYFILKSNEIIQKTGILFSKYDSYTYNQFETIEYRQNSIGRKFNFGTVIIKISSMDSNLELKEVPDPEKLTNELREFIEASKIKFTKPDYR